jgi:ABC-type transport system substrate-binding protein
MSSINYWHSFARNRLSRRRALIATSGAAAGAAFLAACGGGSDSTPATKEEGSSLVSKPLDGAAQAKSGGTVRDFANADIVNFDVLSANNASTTNQVMLFAYSRLMKFATAKYPKEADGSQEGDLAESWELSPDRSTLTFKLRQGVKWDGRAPTNGRLFDAEDVMQSWQKYARLNTTASNLVYNAETAPSAPIESITSPDSRTIVMKMKQFDSSLFQLLASWDHFYVMPKESMNGGFDPRQTVRGTGPWQLEEYLASSRIVWRRNPDYFVKDRPYPDKIERPIITDYAQLLAQFRAGNVWTTAPRQEDIVQTKKDVPATLLHQAPSFATAISPVITFGYEGDSPFKDTRMRQALSMLIDREAFIDVIDNRQGYKQDGLELPVAYNAAVSAGWTGYYVDPTNEKEFGPNAKYLKLNVTEAKKLMAAAGFNNGLTTDVYYNADNTYGAEYHKTQQVYEGMLQAGGIKLTHKSFPYQQYRDTYYDAYLSKGYIAGTKKGFNGINHRALRGFPTVAAGLYGTFHKDGGFFQGSTPDGKNPHLGDPKVMDLIDKIKAEPDLKKQQGLVHEAVKYLAGQAYSIPRPASVKAFTLWWPAIGNLGMTSMYSGGGNVIQEERREWFVDQSKPPFTS